MFSCAVSSPSTGRKQSLHNKNVSKSFFLAGEFVGERVRVVKSSCRGLQGIEGTILDETLNTFLIETRKGRKRVPKKGSIFLFEAYPDFEVQGALIAFRPQDRTKKLFPKLLKKTMRKKRVGKR